MRLVVEVVGTELVVDMFGKPFLVDIVFVVGSLGKVEVLGMGFVEGMVVEELVLDMLDMMDKVLVVEELGMMDMG
jgi:hypothetical protein